MLGNIEFWKMLTTLVWPACFLIVFFVMKNKIIDLFEKSELNFEIAGIKIRVIDATKTIGQQLVDLQERVSRIESSENIESINKNNTSIDLKEPLKILWVDDYPSNNAFLIEKLKKEGFLLQISLETEDALNQMMVNKYDIIITDLGRREGNKSNAWAGLHLIQKIRDAGDQVPILIYAGARGIENSDKLLRAGASKVTQDAVELLSFIAKTTKERSR